MKQPIECADGGILREIARGPWGQLTLRTVLPGKTVGGHSHPNTSELWWIVSGNAEIRLDFGAWETTIRPAPWDVTRVNAGARHWLANVGEIDLVMVYWADKVYEEQEKRFIDGDGISS